MTNLLLGGQYGQSIYDTEAVGALPRAKAEWRQISKSATKQTAAAAAGACADVGFLRAFSTVPCMAEMATSLAL